jgi:ribosomal protein L7/L12
MFNVTAFGALISYVTKLTDRALDRFEVGNLEAFVKESNEQSAYNPNSVVVTNVNYLLDSLANNKKIDAIKAYRALTGSPLKDSKEIIEKVYNSIHDEHLNALRRRDEALENGYAYK